LAVCNTGDHLAAVNDVIDRQPKNVVLISTDIPHPAANVNIMFVNTVGSIPRHADFHAAPQNSPFATVFAAYSGKMWNCPFFATIISNSSFFGLLFNFTIYKTIKSGRFKHTFKIIMSIMT